MLLTLPVKQKKLSERKTPANKYLKLAKRFYKIVYKKYGKDYSKLNPFNLRYQNCKNTSKKIQNYNYEINRIINDYSYYISSKARSYQFRNFLTHNMKKIPVEEKVIIKDTKNMLRYIKLESENKESSQIQPKPKYYKREKIQKFPQLNNIETSYISSLIIT